MKRGWLSFTPALIGLVFAFLRLRAGYVSMAMMVGALSLLAQVNVPTQHNDNARTGLNSNETQLTPTNVNMYGFGKIFSQPIDGPMYAQPLYLSSVNVPGRGTHNLVFAATQHDSVYAFDADTNMPPIWHVSFINPAAGIIAASTLDAVDFPYQDCRTFVGEIGIVGTPAIDVTNGTIYVVARTKELQPNQTYLQFQRLHALDITTGAERANSPVTIAASVPGTAPDNVSGQVLFNPARLVQRPGLLLSGGVIYASWCSYCDLDPYHGWIIGYNAQTLQQVGVFNVSPNTREGGIWMSGAGLAADSTGALYCITGNGTFDTNATPHEFGDSVLKLILTTNLVVTDHFTPFNQASMDSGDNDLGSGGAVVLPDSVGSTNHPHLLFAAGKDGITYLLDRDNLGHFNPANNNQIVQQLPFYANQSFPPHLFGLPAIFKSRLYLQAVGEYLKAYAFTNGLLNATPLSQATETVGFRGATPSISADGTNNGVVWQLIPGATANPGLRAYDADNLGRKLYDSIVSTQAGLPDQLSFVKFVVPTVANGKVYLGTIDSLAVFGLRGFVWSVTRQSATHSVHLVFSGPTDRTNYLQMSTDLIHWSNLTNGTPTGTGTYTYDDPLPAGAAARFYRVGQ